MSEHFGHYLPIPNGNLHNHIQSRSDIGAKRLLVRLWYFYALKHQKGSERTKRKIVYFILVYFFFFCCYIYTRCVLFSNFHIVTISTQFVCFLHFGITHNFNSLKHFADHKRQFSISIRKIYKKKKYWTNCVMRVFV